VERGNPINSLILKIVGLLVCDTLRERNDEVILLSRNKNWDAPAKKVVATVL
jgi:hypothetical protein